MVQLLIIKPIIVAINVATQRFWLHTLQASLALFQKIYTVTIVYHCVTKLMFLVSDHFCVTQLDITRPLSAERLSDYSDC